MPGRLQRIQTGVGDLDRVQFNSQREVGRIAGAPAVRGKLVVEKEVFRTSAGLTGDLHRAVYAGPGNHTLTAPRATDAGPGQCQVIFVKHAGSGALWFAAAAGDSVAKLPRILLGPGDEIMAVSDAENAWSVLRPFEHASLRLVVEDDFHSPAELNVGVPVTTGAGAQFTAQTGDQTRPGVCRAETGTTTTGACGVLSGNSVVRLGSALWYVRADVRIPTLSDGTERFSVRAGGFGDSGIAESVDGVFFRYADNVNSGRWQGVARANSTESTLDTGAAPSANAWQRLELLVDEKAAEARFLVNGVDRGTIATNIPSASGRELGLLPTMILKSLGTTSRSIEIDLYQAHAWFRAARA